MQQNISNLQLSLHYLSSCTLEEQKQALAFLTTQKKIVKSTDHNIQKNKNKEQVTILLKNLIKNNPAQILRYQKRKLIKTDTL